MDMEQVLLIGIVLCVLMLIIIAVRRRAIERSDSGSVTETVKTVESKPVEEINSEPKAPEVQQGPPVVTIFEDTLQRQARRCPNCDGENRPGTTVCEVCARKL